MKEKVIAIVGRPNVGKSTLINRIKGKRLSIVDDMPNITRDRIYVDGSWQGKNFVMIDTGGLMEKNSEGDFIENINQQADLAIEESDLILFLVDGKSGLNPYDYDIANKLRQTKKPVIVVVNKVDSINEENNSSEFWALGFEDLITISALHGDVHVGDLLDIITKDIEADDEEKKEDDAIKIAIIGKPNAGKSSILNNLLNKNRAIVSPISGTTRDTIDEEIIFDNQIFRLVDTAGIRKKSKVDYGVEMFAVDRAIKAIKECDIALLVIDSVEGLSDQDKKIFSIAEEAGVGVILAFNKWDLVKNTQTQTFEKEILKQAPFLSWARKIYISAKTGQRLDNIFKVALEVNEQLNKRISTGLLNKVVNEAVSLNPPTSIKGKFLKIYYTTQAKAHPPTFVIFVNNKDLVQDHYKRYLNKKLRENFGFDGTPIVVSYRQKGDK